MRSTCTMSGYAGVEPKRRLFCNLILGCPELFLGLEWQITAHSLHWGASTGASTGASALLGRPASAGASSWSMSRSPAARPSSHHERTKTGEQAPADKSHPPPALGTRRDTLCQLSIAPSSAARRRDAHPAAPTPSFPHDCPTLTHVRRQPVVHGRTSPAKEEAQPAPRLHHHPLCKHWPTPRCCTARPPGCQLMSPRAPSRSRVVIAAALRPKSHKRAELANHSCPPVQDYVCTNPGPCPPSTRPAQSTLA